MHHSAPLIVGVVPPTEDHLRPQDILEQPLRSAVELRLDLDGAWQAVLERPGALEDRVRWLRHDVSSVSPPPLVIASCRRAQDGGRFDGTEEQRLAVLAACADVCDLVDVESGVKADVPAARTIRSFHDMHGVPGDLPGLLAAMREQGGALFKIAGMARRLSDTLTIRDFLKDHSDVSAFMMGELGVPSRILGPLWGSALNYSALGVGEIAAGIVEFRRMVALYRAHEISPNWEFYGVTGRSVAHSLSPALHNVALAHQHQRRVYLPLAAKDADDLLEFAERLPLSGASVTIPFKQTLLPKCRKLDDAAVATGAVNTIVRLPDGGYRGKNTDVQGFLDAAKTRYGRTLFGRTALVLGAGGAARAVVHGLRKEGTRVLVWSRRTEQATELAQALGVQAVEDVSGLKDRCDLLVNATPCGMNGYPEHAQPWPMLQALLAPDCLVFDLVYEPSETPLLTCALDEDISACNGLGMLRRQAALQAAAFGYKLRLDLPEPPMVSRHVWLIGGRAAGKTALARELAVRLHRRAVDLDEQIELRAQERIQDMFARGARSAFRQLETLLLEHVAAGKPDAVIAAGAGAVEEKVNIRRMRDSGVVLFIDTPQDWMVRRLEESIERPSLTGKPVAKESPGIMARRRPLYERAAHIRIEVTEQDVRRQAGAIADRLAEFGRL